LQGFYYDNKISTLPVYWKCGRGGGVTVYGEYKIKSPACNTSGFLHWFLSKKVIAGIRYESRVNCCRGFSEPSAVGGYPSADAVGWCRPGLVTEEPGRWRWDVTRCRWCPGRRSVFSYRKKIPGCLRIGVVAFSNSSPVLGRHWSNGTIYVDSARYQLPQSILAHPQNLSTPCTYCVIFTAEDLLFKLYFCFF
jgi:hypothetical protein